VPKLDFRLRYWKPEKTILVESKKSNGKVKLKCLKLLTFELAKSNLVSARSKILQLSKSQLLTAIAGIG
jgi:hypothetical protein